MMSYILDQALDTYFLFKEKFFSTRQLFLF